MKKNFDSEQDDLYVEDLEKSEETVQDTDEDFDDMELLDLII